MSDKDEPAAKLPPRKPGELKERYPPYDPEADKRADRDVTEMFDQIKRKGS